MIKRIFKKIIPARILNFYYQVFPAFGAFFYRFPSKKLTIIGITGTNGKSTVVQLTTNILQEAGFKTASVSSIRFQINDRERQNDLKMTMPGRLKLQKFLREAVNAGCQYAVLEITSEGIKQFRHKFIDFDTAVFTNLTKEHIEAHGGFDNYKKAKAELFKAANKIHIINIDDKEAEYFLQFPAQKKYTYGLNQGDINNKELQLNLQLIGDFNIYNSLAAIGVGLSLGVSLKICKKVVERVNKIPGRMELVVKEPFKIYVDYAHTPDALENVYKTLIGNRLICVLGSCGGGRDRWKRPELGKIAVNYCSQIILTNEDPYNERPQNILKEIEKGILKYKSPSIHHQLIFDRRGAIKQALILANPGDTIIITGKGSEPWMCMSNHKKIPWDDRKVVKEELEKLNLEK